MAVLRSPALLAVLVASACAVEPTRTAAQAIIGGETSAPTSFTATGMIVAGLYLRCTATLIAPDVALTAGHCIEPPVFGSLGFTLDLDAADGTDNVVPIAFAHHHPDFDDRHQGYVGLGARNDIAIVILEHPITSVEPARIDDATNVAQLDPGASLALCGYGTIEWQTGTTPRKRDAEVVVARVEALEFSTVATGPQACNGDSGGPLYVSAPDGPRIAGIVSRAASDSEMCDTGAIITRVGPYAAWIAEASRDRDAGCNAGGGSAGGLLAGLAVLLAPRRRRIPG